MTRNEYLLEQVAERLGVIKPPPEDVPAISSDAVAALMPLLSDGGKKRLAELAEQTAVARKTIADAKAAGAQRDRVNAELADARKQRDERLANELAAHSGEMDKRTRDVEIREAAAAKKESEIAKLEAKQKADRAELDKKIRAVQAAAA
jgi:hypothetical protein